MLYTEEMVRENLRNRQGKRVFCLGREDRLTPGARDYLTRERIEILPPEQMKPARYSLENGGYLEEKPEDMTHLNGEILVSKRHPRIAFRGALDTLEAELILAALAAEPPIREQVEQVLALARRVMRCDVLNEPLPESRLCGLTEEEQRAHSQFPQTYYAQPHFMPGPGDGYAMARLNRARCAAREAELRAVAAFDGREGNPDRGDMIRCLNRMSSMLYILMIRLKAAGS